MRGKGLRAFDSSMKDFVEFCVITSFPINAVPHTYSDFTLLTGGR